MNERTQRPLSPGVVLAVLGMGLVLLVAMVWLQVLAVGLVRGLPMSAALTTVARDPGALGLAQLVGLGAPLLFATRLLGVSPWTFFTRALTPCPWDRVLAAFVAGLALQLPMVEISHVVADLVPALARTADEEAALRETMRIQSIYSAIAVPLALVVLAPVTEELLFRAFAQRELVDRLGAGLGVGLVAVLFAVFHMDPASAPAILPAGLALGALAHRWQSVRITIALHAGVNLVPVVITEPVLPIAGFNDTDPSVHVGVVPLLASATLFALAFTWSMSRRDERTKTP